MRPHAIGRSCCVVFLLSTFWGTGTASGAASDLDRLELVGPVRSVLTKHPQLKTIHQFDRAGNLVELELVPVIEAGSARYVYLHDGEGQLVEEQTYEPNGSLVYRKVYRRAADERGRRSAQIAATESGSFAHAEFSFYDAAGLLAEELLITGQGLAEKSLFDVRGNVIYHARYFQGRVVLEMTHHYGPLGRLKESRYYSADGELIRKDTYRYDASGRRIEQTSDFLKQQAHLRKSKVTYEFDQAGNWTKETIQRWTSGSSTAPTETVVSRERTFDYSDVSR